ncbi:MAG TPA: hypothetical protein VMZ90_13365 [Vicinamibacterales bacterium]|nr:hypothetical protein [Vicinamibacterales bacterium]
MTRPFRSLTVLVLAGVLAGISAAGCSPIGPSSSPEVRPTAALTVETFTGTLPLKGAAFYSFSVVERGTTYLSLINLKEGGVDSGVKVSIGLGTPRNTTCATSNILSVLANGELSLTGVTDRGVHCAVIFDTGNLTKDATFSLNITHPK